MLETLQICDHCQCTVNAGSTEAATWWCIGLNVWQTNEPASDHRITLHLCDRCMDNLHLREHFHLSRRAKPSLADRLMTIFEEIAANTTKPSP